jgi:cobalt-zinc-cadmium efflux system outer membrane protein
LAQAQSSAPSQLSVEEAVSQAIKNNPRLSAAARQVAAAKFGVRAAGALANPQVSFTPGVTSISGTGEELLISQPLELNGARSARTGIATAQLKRTQAEATVELRTLVVETKSAYFELARAQERLSLAKELLSFVEDFDRLAKLQVEAGARPGIELAQTSIEIARARQQLVQAEAGVSTVSAALNALLGRASDSPVSATTIPSFVPKVLNRDELLSQALQARSEIAVEEAEADSFRQEARLARAEGIPDVAPQIRVGSLLRGVPSPSSGNGFGVGVAINLPFFDHGSRRNRIRQAEESARAQTDRTAAARNDVRRDVDQALARYRAAEAVLAEFHKGFLDNAKRLLEASQIGFREGKTSILALLEAQRTYRSVQTDYVNAKADSALAFAELERATGAISPTLLPEVRK